MGLMDCVETNTLCVIGILIRAASYYRINVKLLCIVVYTSYTGEENVSPINSKIYSIT